MHNYFFGGFVAQKQVTDKLALGAEIYSMGRSGKFIAPLTLVNIGTQYTVVPRCTLFASMAHSFAGESLWMAYVGIGWELGAQA